MGTPTEDAYRSAFGNWERRASVRNQPKRVLDETGEPALFFPPELVPHARHPLVERDPDVRHRLLVHAMYQYLHFTTVLEQAAVIPVTASISLGRSGISLPAEMRSDAFKITTDEAWHAQFSHDFMGEITRVTGIETNALVEPRMIRRLETARHAFDPVIRRLADLIFAVVSETLISGLLTGIPFDRRLPAPVRALIADHAADEGRHHSYFRDVLRRMWPQLEQEKRALLGPRVPDFIRVFLDPDLNAASSALRVSGFSASEITEIIADSYGPDAACWNILPAAHSTVRAFAEVGALDDSRIYAAFTEAGLLPILS